MLQERMKKRVAQKSEKRPQSAWLMVEAWR
jgi:hypothetical protein